ncbi:MAG: DNA gyrase inhibitor YacG [Planctomycetes bacterium]|nr:DNA gyrase inhibitor YacG [Planctomycetota bacterium]
MPRLRRRKCPQCSRHFTSAGLADNPAFPFCSEKCKLLDLGTWLSDGYAVVEDLSRGHDLAKGLPDPKSITDPDVRAALEDLENG